MGLRAEEWLLPAQRLIGRVRYRHGPYAALFEPYHGDEVIALDCETTGLDSRAAELVSVAAIRVSGQRLLTSQALQINLQPPASLAADSIRIHRLRPIDLQEGAETREALEQLLAFIGNRPLLGWFIGFDIAIVNRYLRPLCGFSLPNRRIEISRLYQRSLNRRQPDVTPDLSFDSIAQALDIPVLSRHTALGDATTAALIYQRLMRL